MESSKLKSYLHHYKHKLLCISHEGFIVMWWVKIMPGLKWAYGNCFHEVKIALSLLLGIDWNVFLSCLLLLNSLSFFIMPLFRYSLSKLYYYCLKIYLPILINVYLFINIYNLSNLIYINKYTFKYFIKKCNMLLKIQKNKKSH